MKIITRYILREFLLTFLIAFLFFFVMFFINHILVNIKPLLEKSIPFNLVAMMMVTFFPIILIFSLPFGTMLSVLMTMGRFSSDNEIIAFRSLGFNYMRIFGPIFICGMLITIATFLVNDRLVPISWHQQSIIRRKITQIKPTLNFKSQTVMKYNPTKKDVKTIYTYIVKEDKIEGLFIIDKDSNNQTRIITAKSAEIVQNKNKKSVIELRMYNAMIQLENTDRPNEFNFGYADTISYFIDLQDFVDIDPPMYVTTTWETYLKVQKHKKINMKDKLRKKNMIVNVFENTRFLKYNNTQYLNNKISYNKLMNNLNTMDENILNLLKLKDNLENDKYAPLNDGLIELYRKFTNPLACIIFAIFAAPIGIYSKRAGFQIGFIVGLFLTAIYWFSFSGTLIIGRKFILPPFIAMSLPNLVFLIIGLFFLYKRLKE